MPRLELHRLAAEIGDVDGIGPEVIAVARRRPLGNEARRHRDLDLAGYGAVHLYGLQLYAVGTLPFILGKGLWPKAPHERKAAHVFGFGPGLDRTRPAA